MVAVQPRTDRDTILFAPGVVLEFSRTVVASCTVKFRLQLRATFRGALQNIVRFDHAHGGPVHRHLCWLEGEPSDHIGPFDDLDDAWTWCRQDLRRHGVAYVRQAERYFTKKGQ